MDLALDVVTNKTSDAISTAWGIVSDPGNEIPEILPTDAACDSGSAGGGRFAVALTSKRYANGGSGLAPH